MIGVHSPGYSFGRDRDTVARAVERLEIEYPVVLDPDFEIWREYGNKGWPGRYLFDRSGMLRYIHYGEGDYEETERAIGECVGSTLEPTASRVRPEDAPGVLLEPQTADIALPADRDRLELVRDWTDGEDWIEAADAGAAASFSYSAGAALRGAVRRDVEPGLYEMDGTVEAESPGLRLHGVQFTPAVAASAFLISLREHEADVLLDDLELRDVRRCRARGRSPTRRCTSSSGALAPERDAHDALALEPLLLHLALVVDQVRLGAVVARDLHEPVRVRRVARADHEHEVALARPSGARPAGGSWWRNRCRRLRAR